MRKFDTIAEYNTIKVRMSGNNYYPRITIERETGTRRYTPHGEYDIKRIQDLISSQRGSLNIDIIESVVEKTFEKWITRPCQEVDL